MNHVTPATPLSGQSAARILKIYIVCKSTKFDDYSFSRSRDISRSVKF